MADLPVPAAPRELTQKEHEAQASLAFEIERRIKNHRLGLEGAWWDLAEALYEFDELQGWGLVGHETLAEFLAQPDLGMSERNYHYAVTSWRELVVERQLAPSELKEIPHTKVREVVPAIKSGKVKVRQALDDAKALSVRDVKEKYRQINVNRHGQQPDNSTKLDASKEPQRVRCPTCRQWTTEDRLPKPVEGNGQPEED